MKIFIKLACLVLVVMLLPEQAFAGVFTPVPTDKSVSLLGYIFGSHIGGVYLGGAPNPTLARMFELLNAVVLSLGVLIISYVGVVSTLNTAQEGQAMGRKWSSMWIPLRAALGMICIVPIPASGYSAIQAMVMWCILQGVGAADMLWNVVVGDLGRGVMVLQAVQLDQPATVVAHEVMLGHGAQLADDMLHSAVCSSALHRLGNGTVQNVAGFNNGANSLSSRVGGLVRVYKDNAATRSTVTRDRAQVVGSINIGIPHHDEFSAVCGKYRISAIVDRNEWPEPERVTEQELLATANKIYLQKQTALHLMFSELKPLADDIVDGRVGPRNNAGQLVADGVPPYPGGYRNQATKLYAQVLGNLIKPRVEDGFQQVVREGMKHGWVSAGSFYFNLNQASRVELFDDVRNPPVAQDVPRCTREEACLGHVARNPAILNGKLWKLLESAQEFKYFGNRLWDANLYLAFDIVTNSVYEPLALGAPGAEAEANPLHGVQNEATRLMSEMMGNQHADPLISQGLFGVALMLGTENAWLEQQGNLQTRLNRAEQNGTPITRELLNELNELSQMGSLSLTIYGIVWVIGAMLAIYVPLIPYMMFTVGIVGWLLLVVEAMVAAPMMSLGFVAPSGDELGKAVQGLMLLLNIVLRPVLMLFGFILATRLYQAVVKLVNFGIISNYSSLQTGDSLFAWVAVACLYAGFVSILSNKCFALIYGLPDKVLRWLGGSPEHTDASQELSQAKGVMSQGAENVNKISTGLAERNAARLQQRLQRLQPPDAVLNP